MLCLLNTGPPFISAGIPPHKKGHKAQNTVSFILYVPWNGEKAQTYIMDLILYSLNHFSISPRPGWWPLNRLVCAVPHTVTSYVSFPHITTVRIDPPISKEQKNGFCMPSSVKQSIWKVICQKTSNSWLYPIIELVLHLQQAKTLNKTSSERGHEGFDPLPRGIWISLSVRAEHKILLGTGSNLQLLL